MIAVSPALAQNDAITQYFGDYDQKEDLTTISISGKAFEMLEEVDTDDPDAQKMLEVASSIESMRMVIDEEEPNARRLAMEAHEKVLRRFEDLVTISEKDALVYVMVDESNGTVHEVLVIVGSDQEFILASLKGEMELRDVGALTSQLSNMGKEVFDQSPFAPNDVKVYPNPGKMGEPVSVELPEELKGAKVRVYNSAGKEVTSFMAGSDRYQIDTNKLGKGIFVLKAKKGDIETTRKFVLN